MAANKLRNVFFGFTRIIEVRYLVSIYIIALRSQKKPSLYYISEYVAFKEGYSVDIADVHGDESKFLENISRGKLSHPPLDLYDFSQ